MNSFTITNKNFSQASYGLPHGLQRAGHLLKVNAPTLIVAGALILCVLCAPTFGVKVDTLKAPIADLKETIFGGWIWIPKIAAAVGGIVLSVYNQSILPLATGAGIGLGIHFYDSYIDASGALI
jgi:hypothetical protein